MPLRECRAAWLARDHRLTPDQARRRASARRRRESKPGGQFPPARPSSAGCMTWRPCNTSGCRRRPARHQAPSARAEARCRTVNIGLAAMSGDGPYSAWPSARPGLVTAGSSEQCYLPGHPCRRTATADGAYAAIVPPREKSHQALGAVQTRCYNGNRSGLDNSGKPVKFSVPSKRDFNVAEATVIVKRNAGFPLPARSCGAEPVACYQPWHLPVGLSAGRVPRWPYAGHAAVTAWMESVSGTVSSSSVEAIIMLVTSLPET
jgi:hypothetical protein